MVIDDAGLGLLALKSLIKLVQEQSGLSIPLTVSGTVTQWKPEIAELLYRVLQEALTNVIRHAEASIVEVSVCENEKEITMTLKDDGRCTGDVPPLPGFGLSGMRARCDRAGGSFLIRNCQPHGLMIIAKVPLHNSSIGDDDIEC
ncbi:signal transduction histidine kinase [Paenibacillus baekrokdamisoli]|nr:ATP-binding protein [Paenibacillus baekrokdamisoli]MBB3072723.1 signal transduction histidine kinase [Paenibacillus baekrokdamisoli]